MWWLWCVDVVVGVAVVVVIVNVVGVVSDEITGGHRNVGHVVGV